MNVNFSDANQLIITFNNQAETALLNNGYENLSQDDKNSLLAIIANKENMAFSDITADYILGYHKKLKKASLDQSCTDAIAKGFTSTNGHTYRTNPDDQTNMIGQRMDIMDDSTITTVMWRAEDVNDWISHTVSDWLSLVYKQAFSNKQSQLQKGNSLKKNVDAATDSKGIIAVVWS